MYTTKHTYPSTSTDLSPEEGEMSSITRFAGGEFEYVEGVTKERTTSVVELTKWRWMTKGDKRSKTDPWSIEIDGLDGTFDAVNARKLAAVLLELAATLEHLEAVTA